MRWGRVSISIFLRLSTQYQDERCRTNCVDCLDRTNTAQFAVGQCALGFQLQALGVLDTPRLDTDSDCVRMLEEMYEDHGDTLAVQYGGSQLIHRIKTYRKQSPWTSKGNDIMQTMKRYYSNTMSDAEKQNTINLFLGVFKPNPNSAPIWEREYNSDYYLHHPSVPRPLSIPLTQWWSSSLLPHLPISKQLTDKACTHLSSLQSCHEPLNDYYHPFELTVLQEVFAFHEINHSVRDYMPNFTTDFSPFSPRTRLGKKREEMSSSKTNLATKNPSVAGNSTSSSTTTDDDSDESNENNSELDDEEDLTESESKSPTQQAGSSGLVSFDALFPSMKEEYGVELAPPSPPDLRLYRRAAAISRSSQPLLSRRISSTQLPHPLARPIDHNQPCPVPVHNYSKQLLRPVSPASLAIYQKHVRVGLEGPAQVGNKNQAKMA